MNFDLEIQKYGVSRETIDKIYSFVEILTEWNNKLNLVSKAAINEIWERHVLDSLQLIKYLPNDVKNIVDIGSGSGFPGIIIAIMTKEIFPNAKIKLVESITKKTVYLKDVCFRLGLDNVEVLNQRVENGVFKDVDVITARAVASINILCGYTNKIGGKKTILLLLKGKRYLEENEEALKYWRYHMNVSSNLYSNDGVVLSITDVRKV